MAVTKDIGGNNLKLHYNSSATKYLESLAIGNGKLGASIYGGVENEQIMLNQDSVWFGSFRDRVNPDTKDYIPKLRELIFNDKVWEAEKLAFLSLTATPESERAYQPMAFYHLNFYYPKTKGDKFSYLDDDFVQEAGSIEYTDYKRELDIENAISTVCYNVNGINYKREFLASYPDGIVAVKFTADTKNAISFTARLDRERYYDECLRDGDNMVLINASLGKGGIELCAGVSAYTKNGTVKVIGQHIVVENTDEVVLYLYGNTSFYNEDFQNESIAKLKSFGFDDYDKIKERHIKDYRDIYDRLELEVECDKSKEEIPTDKRLELVRNGEDDISLQVLLYKYGRYLHIAGSREGSLPMNLRGIWNHEFKPAWDSKFTININQEMLYWASDMCNMSECGTPFYDLIERMQKNGQKVAKDMYGVEGFVAHHNTDLWADCAPQDIHRAAFWALGAAWVVLHLWDTYDYNRDEEVLKKYYPIIEDASKFVLNYLVEDPEGYLVTCPSHSPENGYFLDNRKDIRPSITYSPTMDNMVISYLFRRTLESAKILGIENDITNGITEKQSRLRPVKIGKYGQLMEWFKDYDEPEPGHRHIAHMFALHPADDISIHHTPELARAAMATLDRRLAHQCKEDGKNGWTLSWMMLFEARLQRPENAYSYIVNMLKNGVANNLFGLCVTDEIYVLDGNLGMTTAMTELIVQSQSNEISLLPALPEKWNTGKISGVKARGGFVVSVEWENGKLKKAVIKATTDSVLNIRVKQAVTVNSIETNDYISFNAKKGEEFVVYGK